MDKNISQSTTPKNINYHILKLIRKLGLKDDPIWIDIISEDWCIINECFDNVEKKIIKNGGKIIYGWQIWEWENVLVEAEFHSVWEEPKKNTLIDITPKDNNESKILFVKDKTMIFNGSRVDNVRLPLRKDKLINNFIYISKKLNELIENGNHPDNPLISTFNKDEFIELSFSKMKLVEFLKAGANENTKCFCDSGRKYKNCCAF